MIATDTELKKLAKIKHSAQMLYEGLGRQNQKAELNRRLKQEIEYKKAQDGYWIAIQAFSNAIKA